MYGHPFRGSFVGHSGEKCDLTLIVYPWFCHSFCTVFDRYLQKHNIFRAFWSLCSFGALRTPYRKSLFYRHYRGNPYISTFCAWERHSSVRPVFTTIALKKQLFMNFFASYINCLRSVWAPVGCVSLAIADEKDNVPAFLYLFIARALIHKGRRRIQWLRFDGYSVKFAYRPIGQGVTLWKLLCIAFSWI